MTAYVSFVCKPSLALRKKLARRILAGPTKDAPNMNYLLRNNIAVVSLDDGKANVVGHNFLDSVNGALDRAEKESAGAVILTLVIALAAVVFNRFFSFRGED